MGKKISIILPHLHGGGVERMRIQLANEFIKLGYSVEFVLFQKKGELLKLIPKESTVVSLKANRLIKGFYPLIKYFNHEKPDVVLAAMWPITVIVIWASFFCRSKLRVIISEHSTLSKSSLYKKRFNKVYMRLTMISTYPFADKIIGVSNGVVEDLMMLTGSSLPNVCTIYNPAAPTLKEVTSTAKKNNLWKKENSKKLIAIGKIKEAKDYPTLIQAFKVVKKTTEAELLILGEGPERSKIEKLISELNLQGSIQMPGFIQNPVSYLKGADLFVLSSAWEGFGNVIVEALACGVPVVSTDCKSGPSEILENGMYGRLVPVGDPRKLAEAILEELKKDHDPQPLQKHSQDFSAEKIAEQYLELLFPDFED